MTFNPSDDYDDDKICLRVEGEYQGRHAIGYCSPDAQGYSYYDNGDVLSGPTDDQFDAPFRVDIVFHDNELSLEEISNVREEMGTELKSNFYVRVDDVLDAITESDERTPSLARSHSLQDIIELEDGDLV